MRNLFLLGLASVFVAAATAHAGYWEAPTLPNEDIPPWSLNGDPANASITQDGFLRVDVADPGQYHVYQLLGQTAIDAGAGFETAGSVAWRCRVESASQFVDWTTSFAAYAPSPTLADKSDLYVVRMRADGIGAGWPVDSVLWYELDMTEWHNFQMNINPAAQSAELMVDGVSFGNFPVYTAGIPIDPYQGIRFSDQGGQSAGVADWAYVGWGADGQVPTGTYPDATGTTAVPYTPPEPVIEGNFTPVVLPEDKANNNLQAFHTAYTNFPTGEVEFYGVPFSIPTEGDNWWDSRFTSDGIAVADHDLNSITIDVNEYGVTDVYTLINTFAGKAEGDPVARLVFEATDGTTYEWDLIGNVTVRDAGNPGHTSKIDPRYTVNVFQDTGGSKFRLDMQMVELPAEFATKTLATVTLEDWGSMTAGEEPDDWRQRSWLYGVTVNTGGGGPQPLDGDLNGDGTVSSADLDIVRGNWGQTVTGAGNGDANDDGVVNSGDLDIVRANWGRTAAAAVPEPGILAMLLVALGCAALRRR